jgi:hypothetical protein
MSINIDFEALTPSQQEKVSACGGNCSGCAIYLGATPAGEHTYAWHYGVSSGYTVLPVADDSPYFDYESGNISVGEREFTTDGQEVLPPAFEYLVHFDVRKWHELYRERMANGGFASAADEEAFLDCCGCQNRSRLPRRTTERLGLPREAEPAWAANCTVGPWELTKELYDASLAITLIRGGDRIAVV